MSLETIYLIVAALAPVVVIFTYVFYMDRHEREPLRMLVIAFLLGCLSVLPALFIEQWFGRQGWHMFGSWQNTMLFAMVAVALTEEFSKFLFFGGIVYRSKELNEPYDGIIYAVAVSMGFAAVENLFYVFGQPTYDASIYVAKLRAFTAIPAHASFGCLMGFFAGLAKFRKGSTPFYLLLSLLSATVLHGLYDFFFFRSMYPGMIAGGFASLIIGVFLSYKALRWHQKRSPFRNEAAE